MTSALNQIPQDTAVHLLPFLDSRGRGILVALMAGRRIGERVFTDSASREKASNELWEVLYRVAAEDELERGTAA